VISGKKYTVKVSKASGFCPVPVNLNWYIYFDKSPYAALVGCSFPEIA